MSPGKWDNRYDAKDDFKADERELDAGQDDISACGVRLPVEVEDGTKKCGHAEQDGHDHAHDTLRQVPLPCCSMTYVQMVMVDKEMFVFKSNTFELFS